ncbi:MAG: small multi-drug export protein [Candidatus Aenigmarchaeota archaeon]|nr:small multi-drug export protein [Candidatus Aenigmarchaeota archaeon]
MLDNILYTLDIQNPWIIVATLAMAPITEARGAIIYGLSQGLDASNVFFISVALNILALIPLLYILRQKQIMTMIHKIIGKRITKMIEKNKERFELYEELALFGFVAIPAIGTGAWTGALLATVLELNIKKSFIVISAGIIAAALIVFLGTNSVFYLLQ